MRQSAGTLLLLVVSLLTLRGSSCVTVKRPYAPPSSAELLAAVRARTAAVRSLRAETRMSHRSSQGKIKATVRLMGQRGGRLRCDAVSPFDTPLVTLVVNGGQFALVDAQKNRHFYGPASPCNLARLLQVMLEPDDVLTILGGSTPVIAHHSAEVSWDDREGAEVLTLRGKELVQVIRLDGQNRAWNLLSSEVKNASGEVILRVQAGEYHSVGGLSVPRSIYVSQPKVNAELDVSFKQEELNLSLPAEAFELPAAGGMPSQRVECTTVIKL